MINFLKDKRFLKTLAYLAIPIMLNELINSAVNMLDTFMIGTLGDGPVAAVGLSNQVFFLFSVLSFGINSGISIFMGQFMGKNEMSNVHRCMGLAFLLTVAAALVFACGAAFFPRQIMSIYSKDDRVIALGCDYLRIVAASYVLTAIVIVFNSALKVTGSTVQPMLTTLLAFCVNFVGNYIFILKLGYGIKGAAISTITARCCEITVQFLAMLIRKHPVLTKPSDYFRFNFKFCLPFVGVGVPVVLNEAMWGFGTTAYNIAYKYSGTVAQAAVQISSTVQNLFVVAGIGIGAACAILLTNCLGAGDKEKALDYSKRCLFFGCILSIIMGCILAVAAPGIVSCFRLDEMAKGYALKMLYIVAVGILFKTINYINVCGILRSGGDTTFCLVMDGFSVWFIGLPMAFLGSVVFKLPIYVTFAMVYLEEVVKMFFGFKRVIGKKWLKTLV